MKEAFEDFCNKTVMGMSSAELLALHSDNILKKGGNEKLSDEEVEETLEKVAFRHFQNFGYVVKRVRSVLLKVFCPFSLFLDRQCSCVHQ